MDRPLRRILHIDMDAFFASVEQRDDATLRGKPVAVGGQPDRRGVVAASSYEARAFGVRSAMPMARALRLCPALVVVSPHFQRYQEVSRAVFALFRTVTPLVEPLSIDEAYLDVTENAWSEPLGMNVARRLKEAIRTETGLTASAGVAPNKFLAKIASAWRKPDGLTVIAPERVESFLRGLPVDALWGVGPVTAHKLEAAGFSKLVDLRGADLRVLRRLVGSAAETLLALAHGVDERPIVPDRVRKSTGSERTFAADLSDLAEIRAAVAGLAEQTAEWLEGHGLAARTVTLKVRYGDFVTITRSVSAPVAPSGPGGPPRAAAEIATRALELLDKTEAGRRPIRLLGVSLHGLSPIDGPAKSESPAQLDLPV